MTVFTTQEQEEVDRANAEVKRLVMFILGLWLLASSWDRWRAFYEEQGYTFQGASANLNPWTEDRVNTKNSQRGPLLLIASEKDYTVPVAVVAAEYKLQQYNPGVTEFHEILVAGIRSPSTTAGVKWPKSRSPSSPGNCSSARSG